MLLDSNIIIYAAEPGFDALRNFIVESKPIVSIISKVEVLGYHKLTSENRHKLEQIFHIMPILSSSDDVIDRAISLRQMRKISLGDSLIAGTALTHDLVLVTANVKDYDWIDNLTIFNPLSEL